MCCIFGCHDARTPERSPSPVRVPAATSWQGADKHFASSSSVDPPALQTVRGSAAPYAPPSGPPPSQRQGHDKRFGPPSGLTSSKSCGWIASSPPEATDDWIVPPQEPPHHDWQNEVPHTALFPPPPPFFTGHDRSHTTNASEEEAIAGEDWCQRYPLAAPLRFNAAGQALLQAGDISLLPPATFQGKLKQLGRGRWKVSTPRKSRDCCIIGWPPLYVPNLQHPSFTQRPKTIYFEVHITSQSRDSCFALGFTALPYPTFRLPGWHRGSLAVHGDDGRKYINDRWGGQDFSESFRRGCVYGLGMTFSAPAADAQRLQVEVFFTRDGVKLGGWDLHAEMDSEQDLPVTGLEGDLDLTCAIGSFGAVKGNIVLDASRWKYKDVC